jgi:hypothetical protein
MHVLQAGSSFNRNNFERLLSPLQNIKMRAEKSCVKNKKKSGIMEWRQARSLPTPLPLHVCTFHMQA